MGNRNHEVDTYLESVIPERRAALSELRSLVLEVPDAIEAIMGGEEQRLR
jgi:hypothetical protein